MIKRSTTGTGQDTFAKRTSESGFDTHGKVAQEIKRRCLTVLGFDEYIEGHTDGLQILRYNTSKAYIAHQDYMDVVNPRSNYNFDSAKKGGNRFATILLYMSDLSEHDGGETVFEKAWPVGVPEGERKDLKTAIRELRASGDSSHLKEGSWEEEMAALCRSRLAIRPHSSRAVLFYSQLPNGKEDLFAKHGGCPVLSDTPKWAANLWTWNAPREGFVGAPMKEGTSTTSSPKQANKQLQAVFKNLGNDPHFKEAELYFEETLWGKLGHGDPPLVAYTYEGEK
jgi:hypothetical protein